ncbi:hypothetical protein PAXINDRAFT_18670, partial [Paxillus involutus ATCC 200175]
RTSLNVDVVDVETDDNHAEDDDHTQQPSRHPVGTPDGDLRRPNGPTEPPDEEKGARRGNGEMKVDRRVETVEEVEMNASRRVDEPGDEEVEESRSRGVEGETGGQSEDDGCQRDGRTIDTGDATSGTTPDSKRVEAGPLADDEDGQQRNGKPDVTKHVPGPPTPHPSDTTRPTHLANPPRRRGRLKTPPTNVSKPELQPDVTEAVRSYRGSVPKPPQSRSKGTEACPHLSVPILFSYRFNGSHRPLTKTKFTQRIAEAAKAAGLEPLQGHGMRIGGTLEYLMRNVSFETVKAKGCWKSDAFQLYLRKHAQILAIHMQKHPTLHEEFIRYTMPTAENSRKSSSSSYHCGFLRHTRRVVGLLPSWGSQLTSSHTGS